MKHKRRGTAINTSQRLFNAPGEHLDSVIYTTEPLSTGYMIPCASVQRVMLTHQPITLTNKAKICRWYIQYIDMASISILCLWLYWWGH